MHPFVSFVLLMLPAMFFVTVLVVLPAPAPKVDLTKMNPKDFAQQYVKFVTLPDGRVLEYMICGPVDGKHKRTIVATHGFGETCAMYLETCPLVKHLDG